MNKRGCQENIQVHVKRSSLERRNLRSLTIVTTQCVRNISFASTAMVLIFTACCWCLGGFSKSYITFPNGHSFGKERVGRQRDSVRTFDLKSAHLLVY